MPKPTGPLLTDAMLANLIRKEPDGVAAWRAEIEDHDRYLDVAFQPTFLTKWAWLYSSCREGARAFPPLINAHVEGSYAAKSVLIRSLATAAFTQTSAPEVCVYFWLAVSMMFGEDGVNRGVGVRTNEDLQLGRMVMYHLSHYNTATVSTMRIIMCVSRCYGPIPEKEMDDVWIPYYKARAEDKAQTRRIVDQIVAKYGVGFNADMM